MKYLSDHPTARRPIRAWCSFVFVALALCAGFAVPSSGAAGGGETVGTLPNTGGRGSGLDISRPFRDPSPAMFLQGPIQQINGMLLGWNGRAIITEEILDPSTQIVRLTFHGDFRLDLDRLAFEQGTVAIGWTAPQTIGSVRATMLLGGRTLDTGLVSDRTVILPVFQMDASGGLDVAPLAIVTNDRQGLHASLDIVAHGDELILTQTH
jgi:hypothetical protein